jgi:hypothetical protein
MARRISNSLYQRLTPIERHRLVIDAHARSDLEEVRRLSDTCPEQKYWTQDPGYAERMKASLVIALAAANTLLSARLAMEPAIAADELTNGLHELLATEVSTAAADEVAASEESMMIERAYCDRASDMVGVYEGIRSFCGAIGVFPERLLCLDRNCLPLWEFGSELAESHACNEAIRDAVSSSLTALWSGFVPPGSD